MNPIAIYSGQTIIFWSGIVISLGLAASAILALSLYRADGGRASIFVFLPVAVVLSVPLCRFIHWYCHIEQYAGLLKAMTDYSNGGYCLPGALLGSFLAAFITARLGFAESTASLLDAAAPGGALCIAFIRLSSLFSKSCRGTVTVVTPALQRLPFASAVLSSTGSVEYRFATFFIQFLLMLALTAVLTVFYSNRRRRPLKPGCPEDGNIALLFMLFYSAIELVLDSTRYDSSFLHSNGFVSLVQIIAAVSILVILIRYSVLSVRVNGRRAYHWALWGAYVLSLAGVGATEYLVQRHGSWYISCYTGMSVACAVMAAVVYLMYLSLREPGAHRGGY